MPGQIAARCPRLPIEVVEKIIRYTNSRRLLTRVLSTPDSGPSLRKIAAEILYRNVSVHLDAWSVGPDSDVEDIRLALSKDDGFAAPYVRTLSISSSLTTPNAVFEDEMKNLSDQVLPLLSNVRKLSVRHCSKDGHEPANRLLNVFLPIRLTHLAWSFWDIDESAFIAFLVAQPELILLDIATGSFTLANLPRDSLLRLQTLRVMINEVLVLNILPGRKISHLDADLSELRKALPADLGDSVDHVTTLCCGLKRTDKAFEYIRCFRNLEYLRLYESTLAELYDYIDVLKPMNIIYLNVYSNVWADREDDRIPSLFEGVVSLRTVDISSREYDSMSHQYLRYRRGSLDKPTRLSIHMNPWEPWWYSFKYYLDDFCPPVASH